jgi:hypothetical protein
MLSDGLPDLPYLLHTNSELGLMLAGKKPLTCFAYLRGAEAPRTTLRIAARL